MNREFSRGRRFAIALLAVIGAGVLLKGQVAQALVVRGDDYLYRGDRPAALERYRRAMIFAPGLSVAADRYVFVTMLQHTAPSLNAAIGAATEYLRAHPRDARLLSDRGLCYLHLHWYALAERDFERAARQTHSPSDYVFAGWAAHRAGLRRTARMLWKRALRARPGYRPALIALSEQARR